MSAGELSARETDRERHPSAHRFRLAFYGLVALGFCSLGLAVALSPGRRVTVAASDWSSFSPADSGVQGAQDIADYVAPYYRASPSTQLAVVTAVNLNDPAKPLEVVVPSGSGTSTSSLLPLPANSTIVFNLCGTNSGNCTIGTGAASSARLLLLRRESLELALYTFRYIAGIQTVVAILPPGHTGCTGICPKPQSQTPVKTVNIAVAFDRQELIPWLSRPLHDALPEALPPPWPRCRTRRRRSSSTSSPPTACSRNVSSRPRTEARS